MTSSYATCVMALWNRVTDTRRRATPQPNRSVEGRRLKARRSAARS